MINDPDSTCQVTVGIPVFNGRDTVLRAVESALSQTGIDLTVVLSDNHSLDGTASHVLERFGGNQRLRVISHAENRGATWNYNWLLESADSEFFMWLAADDWLLPNYVCRCVRKLLDEPTAALAFGQVEMTRSSDEDAFLIYPASRGYGGSTLRRFGTVYRKFPDVYMYGVMRTRTAQRTGGLPNVPAADAAFIRRLSLQGCFVNVPDAYFAYSTGNEWKDAQRIVTDESPSQTADRSNTFRGRRSLLLMMDALKAAGERPRSGGSTVGLRILVVAGEIERVLKRLIIDSLGCVLPRPLRLRVAQAIHDRWLAKERPVVVDSAVYMSRVVLPALRWR